MSTRSIRWILPLATLLAACAGAASPQALTPEPTAEATHVVTTPEQYADARAAMVDVVRDWGVTDEQALSALERVPRHRFVPETYLSQAYENHPLPIGYGQTISQPYIVGLMTAELGVTAGDKVLEVGTGSGYQAAVVAELGTEVYSIEIIGALAEAAEERLAALGYDNIHLRHADGYFGWPEDAPFDGILVTAAPDHVPQPLINQLAIGASLIIPVGPPGGYQELWKITKVSEEETERVSLGGVRFVPLTREEGG